MILGLQPTNSKEYPLAQICTWHIECMAWQPISITFLDFQLNCEGLPTWKTHWTDESWSGALPTWISIILKICPQFFWFSPHTAIQSCFPCDNVGLRGSHSHCCKSGRKGERCPNKSKSPWKEITSWANLRVHARYCISYQILNTRRYHIKHFPNNNFQYVPTKGEFFSPVPPKAPNFSTKKKNNQSQSLLATGFTGTAAVIGCLRVFFLVLKLGVTSEKTHSVHYYKSKVMKCVDFRNRYWWLECSGYPGG